MIVISTNAQQKDPDSLIRKAFNAIKTQDENAYLALFPDYRQTKLFLEDVIKNTKDSSLKKKFQKVMAELTDSSWNQTVQSMVRENFREQLGELRNKKIRPDSLEITNVIYKEMDAPAELGGGLKSIAGTIYLRNGNDDLELPFSDVIWVEKQQGWFGINFRSLRKKGEMEVIDSVIEADSIAKVDEMITVEEAPPPPPLPAKKTVKKAPTKSPAKKPN